MAPVAVFNALPASILLSTPLKYHFNHSLCFTLLREEGCVLMIPVRRELITTVFTQSGCSMDSNKCLLNYISNRKLLFE